MRDELWIIILLAGAGTYGIQLSVLVFVHHNALPRTARQALRFVTPAVLAANHRSGRRLHPARGTPMPRPATNASLAAVVAWVTNSVWATIAIGMAPLWMLQWASG